MLQSRLETLQNLVDRMAGEIYVLNENFDEDYRIVDGGQPDPILAGLMDRAREERIFHAMGRESIEELRVRALASEAAWGA